MKDERETAEEISARVKHKWADLKRLDPERYQRAKALAPQRMAEIFAAEEACLLEILSDPALSKQEHEEWREICRKWSRQHIDLALKIMEDMNNEDSAVVETNKGGRPSKHHPGIVDRILSALADGLTQKQISNCLTSICAQFHCFAQRVSQR